MDNQITGDRIADILIAKQIDFEQKNMFGGRCFMVDDKMCLGTYKNGLMARVGPEAMEQLAEKPGAAQMIHGGRPMKGYLFVESEGYERDEDLYFWVDQCLAYNPLVKKSKKKG